MTTLRTWLASAALVGGAGGGAFAGLAATDGTSQPAAAAQPKPANVDATRLQAQVDALLHEDRDLERAVRRARQRLAAQVNDREHSLAVLRRRIAAAQDQLARARAQVEAARSQPVAATAAPAAAPVPASATTQTAHTTTGASGATAGGDDAGEHEGGGDD